MQQAALELSQSKRGSPEQPPRRDGPIGQERGDKCIGSWWDGPQAPQGWMDFGSVQVARQTLPGYVPSQATTKDKEGLWERPRKGCETMEKKPHHPPGMQKRRHSRHSLRKSEKNKVKGKIKRARWRCNFKKKKRKKKGEDKVSGDFGEGRISEAGTEESLDAASETEKMYWLRAANCITQGKQGRVA